jgi:diacylglycerol kinase (ATP)
VDVLTELVVYEAALRFDDGPPQTYSALNIVLGNGRFSAGGLRVAPRANPEDGLLDAIIIRDGSPVDLMNMAAHYLLDDYVQSDVVVLRRARRVAVEAEPPIPFSADGDVLGSGPITFTVHAGALPVVVGPEYTPEPENGAE